MTAARWRALTAAACAIFLAYAGCFLYFFVDDEAIPLVYAQNLLRGRGLVYTALEGRVEGYSDFLHVLWLTIPLTITHAFSWSHLTPLLVGKAVSLLAGAGVVVLAAYALARLGVGTAAAAAALACLCLAGPLAVWSASSLETVPFALTVFAFALAVSAERLEAVVVLGTLLTLERIDAPVYLAIVVVAMLAARPRHWRFLAQCTGLLTVVVASYHAWRFVYFGTLLSAPMAAKVMYQLAAPARAIAKSPQVTYLYGLIGLYGWTGVAMLAAAACAAMRHAAGRAAVVVILLIGVYSERVDDWMFGWRFIVAVVPFVAVVVALAIDRLPRAVGVLAAGVVIVWSGTAALDFARLYRTAEDRPLYWLARGAGEAAWLGRYEELLVVSREQMHAGDRIAFNQAGLLPYMLELENIDDLGICSRFVARLPTTDVYFTGVGRYSALSNSPVIRTAHAYLLYRNVQFLISPVDLVMKANRNRIPDEVLDGAFARVPDPRLHENVLYRRTGKPMARFARDPLAFTENVAHYSHVIRAALDGRQLQDSEIGPRLPFLREMALRTRHNGSFLADVTFARTPEEVTDVYVGEIASSSPATLTIALTDASGRVVYETDCPVGENAAPLLLPVPPGTLATALTLDVHAGSGGQLTLADVRVEGQTAALAHYVHRTLRFPSPQW
jgi:hypothetical protein